MLRGAGLPVGRAATVPLIERDDQLRALAGMAEGQPGVAVVEGEAGSGKSRLVREFLARMPANGRRVLLGCCYPTHEPFTLGPIVEALRAVGTDHPQPDQLSPVVGALRPLLPECHGWLPAAPPPAGDPRAERHGRYRAVIELLRSIGPCVLAIEDLHWADRDTRELLGFLAGQLPATLTLILTYRPEDLPARMRQLDLTARLPPGATRVQLALPLLTVAGVQELAASTLGRTEVTPELAAELHRRTAGLPSAVEELLRLLTNGDGTHPDRGVHVSLPGFNAGSNVFNAGSNVFNAGSSVAPSGARALSPGAGALSPGAGALSPGAGALSLGAGALSLGAHPASPRAHAALLDGVGVPPSVRAFVADRLGQLRPDAQRVVVAAAVLRHPASEQVLAQVAGLSAKRAARGLAEALARNLLREAGDGYSPRHDLARAAVAGRVPGPERRARHARAVAALEAGPGSLPLAELAYHAREAGRWLDWQRYAEATADSALAAGDPGAAIEQLQDVLGGGFGRSHRGSPGTTFDPPPDALIDPPALAIPAPARIRMARKLAGIAVRALALDPTPTVVILRRTVDDPSLDISAAGVLNQHTRQHATPIQMLPSVPSGVRGELRLALALLLLGQAGKAMAGQAEAIRAVGELRRRPALAARAMGALALPITVADRHADEHLAWLGKAKELIAAIRDPARRTAVLADQASVLMHLGDPGAWRAASQLPDGAMGGSRDERYQLARGVHELAHACVWLGHHQHAERFLEQGARLMADDPSPWFARQAQAVTLLLDWAVGRWDGLAARARQVAAGASDLPTIAATAELVLGRLALADGELDDADGHLRRARALSGPDASIPIAVAAEGTLVEVLLARPELAAAVELGTSAVDRCRRKGIWVWAHEAAPAAMRALVTAGRLGAARKLLADLDAGLGGRDAPAAAAGLTTCQGILAELEGRQDRAARAFAQAERAFAALPRPYDAAHARESEARCLLAGGRDGTGTLLAAMRAFEALGATWDAARCRQALRRHGVVLPHRRGRRGYGRHLSPREQEVVQHVALGRTNREIAAILFLSPRTVEDHVASALRKLDLHSRKALATTAIQPNLPS